MSVKRDLAREIKDLENEIKELEVKRTRSLAARMESIISKGDPSEEEMQYFRTYTADIDVKREKLSSLIKQLEAFV